MKKNKLIHCFNYNGLGYIPAKYSSPKKESDSKQNSAEKNGGAMTLAANMKIAIAEDWLADSGASAHITGRRE